MASSQFSKDGRYFAQISADGKLKVWETSTSSLLQEFTPNFHLTSPCTCLHFIEPDFSQSTASKNGSPRKKIKRRKSTCESSFNNSSTPYIALGTSSGLLLTYSIAKGDLEHTIKSDLSESINCLSWQEDELIFSGIEQNIVAWNLENKSIKSKWKAGNEKISAILALQENSKILTASKNIKLWDVSKKTVLKQFTGHSNEVSLLSYVKSLNSNSEYFISGSKGDRVLNCWNLDVKQSETNSIASFLMEDVPLNISLTSKKEDGSTNMAVTVRSGVIHIYQHTLNGKCSKPLKPKTTLQIASDTGQTVTSIPLINCIFLQEDLSLLITYGNSLILTFENVSLNQYQKVQCLIRKDPMSIKAGLSKEASQISKIKSPLINNEQVSYLTPHTTNSSSLIPGGTGGGKRKGGGGGDSSNSKMDIPMEKRLENLTLSKLNEENKLRVDNVAQLLLQGIHSKDKNILRSALSRKDETVIRNTIKRLPMQAIEPLIQELCIYVQGKTAMSQIGARWLRIVLQIHAGLLISRPDLSELLGPAMSSLESRLTLQTPLNRLRGRLDMIVSQLSTSNSATENSIETEPILEFDDKAGIGLGGDEEDSDSGAEGMELSQSDNEEWLDGEDEEEEDDQEVNNKAENADINMSTDGEDEKSDDDDSD